MNIVVIGANSEIVKNLCRRYAGNKVHFLLVSRDSEKLQNLKADLISRGAKDVDVSAFSLNKAEDFIKIQEISSNLFNEVDLLVVAHGVLPDQSLFELGKEDVEKVTFANYTSYILALNHFGPIFEKQQKGSIAVISSVAGDRGRRSNYFYGSNKAGVQAFLEGFSARMSRSNVSVLDIRPGMVKTPMTRHLKQGGLFATPEKVAKDIQKAISCKRMVLYTPFFWKYIMLVIKLIPRKIFYKLNF